MSSTIVFTSTLSANLMDWVREYSKENSITKRKVLEDALFKLKQESKQKKMEKSFKKAALDIEIYEMAEEGLEDYNENLNKLGI